MQVKRSGRLVSFPIPENRVNSTKIRNDSYLYDAVSLKLTN